MVDSSMPDEAVDTIWNGVSERFGSDLRGIIRYESTRFETKMRGDIDDSYVKSDFQDIVDKTIVDQLMQKQRDESFRAGQLNGVIRVFDEAIILAWDDGLDSKSGVMISIDRNGNHSSIDDLEWAIRYLDESITLVLDRTSE